MSKNNCCCGPGPDGITFDTFCCNPLLFTDFITLYGDSMAEHAEVSPEDWIALKQSRSLPITSQYNCSFFAASTACNCCCDCRSGSSSNTQANFNTGNKTSLNANDVFDKNNIDGTIIKKNKSKPTKTATVFNNSFFFSANKLNYSRLKVTNPAIVKQNTASGTESYSYNTVSPIQTAVTQYYKAPNVNPGENVDLYFGGDKISGNYVLGQSVDIQEPIDFNEKFSKTTTPPDLGFVNGGLNPNFDWENGVPCTWKCNTIFCCESSQNCPPSPCNDCCCRHKELIGVRAYEPMYFAYKYSGCHFTWYPREMLFGKDPYVPQCTNNEVFTPKTYCDGSGSFELKKSTTTCGVLSLSAPFQGSVSRNDPEVKRWCYETDPEVMATRAYILEPGSINHWACHCATVPHIHGGMVDSLTGTINVSQRPGQLGYVSQFRAFYPPMLASENELGCCWCSSMNPPNIAGVQFAVPEFIAQKTGCNSFYPFTNGIGKVPNFTNPCAPGFSCYWAHGQRPDYLVGNPNYKTTCFKNGISPYLQRVAKTQFKTGYEIFLYGDGSFKNFGSNFIVTQIEPNLITRDYKIKFAEIPNSPTTLRDQCIGFVQLEHHFECCAFRSDVGIATKNPGLIINSCGANIPLFEAEGYPGNFTEAPGPVCGTAPGWTYKRVKYTAYHYSSTLWQIKRGVPRRVMYAGSGIPLFKFDLVNMENWTIQNPQPEGYFSAETFIEHYYRYYFGLMSFNGRGCGSAFQPPEPIEWNYRHFLNSYEYVTTWLEKMVVAGILRIKDHAIDIAKEVNEIIGSASYDSNGNLVLNPEVVKECGGVDGFIDLVNFFEVSPGEISVTPKLVKEKLLNEEGLFTYDGPGKESGSTEIGNGTKMRAFLPRRARLPIGPLDSKIYAWGCNGNSPENQIEGCTTCYALSKDDIPCCLPEISCASYVAESVNIPEILNATTGAFREAQPTRVISGLAGTFVIDRLGKLSIFGGFPQNGDFQSCASTTRFGYPPSPSQPITLNCSYDMHPNSIVNIPWYLSLFSAFDQFGEIKSNDEIPDGKVLDLVFNPNFAVALVEFDKEGLGSWCLASIETGDSWKSAWEWGEWNVNYQTTNTNGSNISLRYNSITQQWEASCIVNEPWGTAAGDIAATAGSDGTYDQNERIGARSTYSNSSKYRAYRLKSWGSQGITYGTFSLCKEDAKIFNYGFNLGLADNCGNNGDIEENEVTACTCADFDSESGFESGYRGYDPKINPDNLRYPGTNTWFIWNKIAGGSKHFAALDDFGGVFITALSSNEDGQSNKGKPLPYFNFDRPESWPQQGYSDPKFYAPDYNGFESRFNYFNHIPRPGFISEQDWSQDLYNSLTSRYSPWLNCNGACQVSVNIGGTDASGSDGTLGTPCTTVSFASDNGALNSIPKMDLCYNDINLVGGSSQISPCVRPIKVFDGITCSFPAVGHPVFQTRVFDLSTYFMGSLCQRSSDPFFTSDLESVVDCKPRYKLGQQEYNDYQPRYIDLAAGAFNTMLLTNENRIEIYGKYYQIDENGNKVGPKIINADGSISQTIQGINCFVPSSVLQKQGTWGITYGCATYCRGITFEVNGVVFENTKGITHNPIISASYTPPSENDKFQILKSSADYSIAITNGNKIYVWGDASMVPGAYAQSTYYPGQTADRELTVADLDSAYASVLSSIPNDKIKIREVAVGIHSFYISYQIQASNVGVPLNRTCVYTRYNRSDFGAELPTDLQNKKLLSISAGNGFAVAITSNGEGPRTWDAESFAPETLKYQYKNFASLPLYLKRDAFFHAIPGNWDYSKWLWGDTCCFAIHDPDHPALEEDRCSALAYNIYRDGDGDPIDSAVPDNDPRRFNKMKSYSGHPEHLWMRSDIRRIVASSIGNVGLRYNDSNEPACSDTDIDGARPSVGSGAGVGDLSDDFGFCFNNSGPAWGSFVPASPLSKIRTKKPSRFPSCAPDACTSRRSSLNRGVCSDLWGAYVCSGTSPSYQTTYSATKDIFQSKIIAWGDNGIGSGDFCYSFESYHVDYFKYSQRSFYLGYDGIKDTWEIYRSPDIFRNTVVNIPVYTDTCCDEQPDPDACPSPNPDNWLCPGITTFIDPKNCGWGGGITQGTAGCTAWPSLANYPMVGPNYTRNDTNVLPPHYPKSSSILQALWYTESYFGIQGGDPCTVDPCYSVLTREAAIRRFAGPGGFAFNFDGLNCNGTVNSNIYTYNPLAYVSDPPSKMLKGIESAISTTVPPESDPNYKSVGFKSVLKNSTYTNINFDDVINKIPIDHTFTFGNYGTQPGTTGKVIQTNHGLTAGNIVIFRSSSNINEIGEAGVIKEVRIKLPGGQPDTQDNFLQLEKAYFVSSKNLFADTFAITETIDDAYQGINMIPFWVASNTGGFTATSFIADNKWYHMFDIIPSNYNGIAGIDYGDTPCFSGGPLDCYIPNLSGVAPIDSEHVIVAIENDPEPNIKGIFGIPWLCILQDCCGEP
jgi:hypothetical protein